MKCRSAVILALPMMLCLLALPCAGLADGSPAFTLNRYAVEITGFVGGGYTAKETVRVMEYSNLSGQPGFEADPTWSFEFDSLPAINSFKIDAYDDAGSISFDIGEYVAVGNYIGTFRCTWGGGSRDVQVVVHVRENPDGPPQGVSGFGGEHLTLALGETLERPYAVLPAGWSSPDYVFCWWDPDVTTWNGSTFSSSTDAFTLADHDGSVFFTGLKPGHYILRKGGYCANYQVMGSLQITVLNADGTEPESSAPTFTLDRDTVEMIRFAGGNYSDSEYVSIVEYNDLAGGPGFEADPVWTLVFDNPEAINDFELDPYDSECCVSLWVGGDTAVGDYTGTLRCSWGGTTRDVNVIVHVPENPNGAPDGISGFGDRVTIAPGETVTRTYDVLPAGWSLSGYDIQWWSAEVWTEDGDYFSSSTDAFDLSNPDGRLSFTGLQPGRYRIDKSGHCANYSFWGSLWITVLNADGTEPASIEHAWPAFMDTEITVRAGEPYVLRFEGDYAGNDSRINSLGEDWFACSDYDISDAEGKITCTTHAAGYYTVCIESWDAFNQQGVISSILIKVADENGNLPETQPLTIYPRWPASAVVGDTLYPSLCWYNAVLPVTWHMTVQQGDEVIREIDEFTGGDWGVLLTETGDYTLACRAEDALGRVATASATAVAAAEHGPLSVDSLEVWFKELGPRSHDAFPRVHYTGGQGPLTFHYQIWAANGFGDWYMTWETDADTSCPYFWLGEDGDHYFKAIVTDGVTTAEVESDHFHVGGWPPATRLVLPENLAAIGAEAFIGTDAIAVVIPPSVNEIDGNPFGSGVWFIYGQPGSYAESYARDNGFTFFPITD